MTAATDTAANTQTITQLLARALDRLADNTHQRPGPTVPNEAQKPIEETGGQPPSSTLGQLIDALDDRAFGLILLLLALPCCIPFLWGIPQIVALPMLALTAQMVMGRHQPWLPSKLAGRSFEIDDMRTVVNRSARYLGWVERLSHPRLAFLTEGNTLRIIAALMLIPTASILIPAPSTNTIPGIGIVIGSVGFIKRDGILVLLGLVIGLTWVALLLGAIIFFGPQGIEIMKDAIKGVIGM